METLDIPGMGYSNVGMVAVLFDSARFSSDAGAGRGSKGASHLLIGALLLFPDGKELRRRRPNDLPLVVQYFLEPATPAVPAATKEDHDNKDDDQKRCVVHFGFLVWPNRST